MEVILRKDIDKVGLRGEVVNVARGYARNFLFPRGLADEATPARVAELRKVEERRARERGEDVRGCAVARRAAGQIELRFDVKAGPTGSLFGSVTPTDIADQLWSKHKVRVDRRKIGIDTIKRIGRHQVPIELFQDVTVEVRTLVVPEGGELPPEEELEAHGGGRASEQAAQPRRHGRAKHELDLDELDAAAPAQDPAVAAAARSQPSTDRRRRRAPRGRLRPRGRRRHVDEQQLGTRSGSVSTTVRGGAEDAVGAITSHIFPCRDSVGCFVESLGITITGSFHCPVN